MRQFATQAEAVAIQPIHDNSLLSTKGHSGALSLETRDDKYSDSTKECSHAVMRARVTTPTRRTPPYPVFHFSFHLFNNMMIIYKGIFSLYNFYQQSKILCNS